MESQTMDRSQLPDVNGLLVTADNPARTGLSGMDHPRCAALHNYLVHYAWAAEGGDPASLRSNHGTFFGMHGNAAGEVGQRIDASVVAFLEAAIVPPSPADTNSPCPPFFFWAEGLSDPEELFANDTADLYDRSADSLLCLYRHGQGGESGGGLFYDQDHHRAAVFMHMDDHGFAMPIEEHQELWHPLETILSNWIDLLHMGKIVASPTDAPSIYDTEKFGPWEWRPYSEAQVASCILSWDRLCSAIEARMAVTLPHLSSTSTSSTTTAVEAEAQPLLEPSTLDEASVPDPSFARAFLTRARRPRFRYIGPGIMLPSANAAEFAAVQAFTRLPRSPRAVPPVCLFPADTGGDTELTESSRFHFVGFSSSPPDPSVPTQAPAGIYSEPVDRTFNDIAEEGFRLLLPYALLGDGTMDDDVGARLSDGSWIQGGEVADLFQHGYKPFGGETYRAQRLERLLDHWREMIEGGIWSVGPKGVVGTIDNFKQADNTDHWMEYRISPTW
ncbi:hypothetical protein PG987_015225 [Apiospora arundinis]